MLSIQFCIIFCRFLGYETSKVALTVHVKTTQSTPQIKFYKQKYGHEEKELLCIVPMVPPRDPRKYPVIFSHLLISCLYAYAFLVKKKSNRAFRQWLPWGFNLKLFYVTKLVYKNIFYKDTVNTRI